MFEGCTPSGREFVKSKRRKVKTVDAANSRFFYFGRKFVDSEFSLVHSYIVVVKIDAPLK